MYGLRALGHDAEIRENSFRPDSKHIVFGGHLLSADSNLPPGSILYNLEQVSTGGYGHTDVLAKRYTLWDYAKPNCDEWAKRGIQAVHVPLGYSPEMTRIKPAEEDIDVLFYGSMNKRRGMVLTQLHNFGLRVVAKINDTYGKDLDAIIARAKVVINIHFAEAPIFEAVRVSYLLANKKAVVSEESMDTYPGVTNALAFAPYKDLSKKCQEVLNNGYRKLAEDGFKAFSALPESEYLKAALA